MTSSTSSSEGEAAEAIPGRPIPAGSGAVALAAGVVLALGLCAAAEVGWRAAGHLATADGEDLDLWAAERRRASNDDEKTLVIIGKSRAHLDFDLPTLKQRYPDHTIVQLALRGRGAWATFEDLVDDPHFKGKIIWSLTAPDLTLGDAEAQKPAVDRARHAGPDTLWNARLRALVSSKLVVRSSMLPLERVLKNFVYGQVPVRNFIVVAPDRGGHANFANADIRLVKQDVLDVQQRAYARLGNMETPVWPWFQQMQRIRPLVIALQQKGGNVAFVHLPVTDESDAFSKRVYPKERFWDQFARTVPALCVHYRDFPMLQSFHAPDSSHLDMKDTPRFTKTLLGILEAKQFLPRGTGSF